MSQRISTQVEDVVENVDEDHAVDVPHISQLQQDDIAVPLVQHIAQQVG